MEVMGVSKITVQSTKQFINTFKENYKNIPDQF